jgi:hypothetical protein
MGLNMDKVVYQPSIIKKADAYIDVLIDDGFFKELEITDLTFAKNELCRILTDKFINGELNESDTELLTAKEAEDYLNLVITESVLRSLQERGLIGSYEDENTEEVFFLTEMGKVMKNEIIYEDLNPSGSLK